MVGTWDINIVVGSLPEKVATAFFNVNILGAEYTPIAYIGSQVVNGINHAVLAEQILTTGRDTKNVVLMIFNEKGMDVTLVDIERVVESGEGFGGTVVDVQTDIPKDAIAEFDIALRDFVGSNVKPFALLATQVVKGIDYIFAAELTTVTETPVKKFVIVTVNSLDHSVIFADVLTSTLNRPVMMA